MYGVADTLHHTDEVVVNVIIDGEEIETTPEHPFYPSALLRASVEGKGWVNAKDLKVGDSIRKADGSTGRVKRVKTEQTTQEMYNLTVDEAHTFFVGDGQWLVHNACEEKIKLAQQLKNEIESTEKTIAVSENGTFTHSGWSNRPGYSQGTKQVLKLAKEMGYEFEPHMFDQGIPGQYYASHAEPQLAVLSPNQPMAVNYQMCTHCQGFFSELAQYRDVEQVVADPDVIRVFFPDGRVQIIP